MSKFKIEINNHELTKKGIEAITDFYHTIAIDELRFSGLNAFATGVESPFLNVVIDTRENSHHSPDIILPIEKFFHSHHIPWTWFVTPLVKTNDLEYSGFSLLEEFPGMYFNLENSRLNTPSNSISIKEVDENDDLSMWIQSIQEGFPSNDHCERYRKLNANLLKRGEKKLRHFIAYHKNQIAGAATLFLSDESVMLHNLATKNAFRKQGIATALSIHMMEEAQQLGYKHCFLDSSEEGLDLYHKLGFKIYCRTLAYKRN